MKAISHLSSLRSKKRRERLEWLGDTVMEEAIVRLVAREATAALEREREEETAAGGGGGSEEEEVPPSLTSTSSTLKWRPDSAIRVVVSNANLSAVYGTHLVGLMGFLGLEEDHLGVRGGKRCRSSSVGLLPPSVTAPTASERKADKLLPDLVESAIGEAFEASLTLGLQTESQLSGPQRFAGRHRAALVDRLLSSALCTEIVLANLDSGRGGGGWPAEGGGAMENSFGVLDTDDDDDDDSVDNGERGEQEGEQKEGREEDKENEEEEEEEEENVVMGDGSRSLDPPGDADVDADVDADARRWAEATGERVQATGEGEVAAVEEEGARRGDSGGNSGGGGGGGGGGSSGDSSGRSGGGSGGSSSSACRRANNFASGMEAFFRLYGAALIKFRVSVFLYCSAASAGVTGVAGGGGDDEQGPSELTMRRQRVMCAENLEAVADYLRPAGESGGALHSPGAPDARDASEAPAARQWMRVAVGRAVLCEGGDALFSTRVAALLLSRSGERGEPPRNGDNARFSSGAAKAEGASARGGGRERAKLNRRETKALAVAAEVEAASVAAATAEMQFRRDPWPEGDLPRASEKAALMFRDRNSRADAGPSRASPPAGLGRGDNPRAVGARLIRGVDCQGDMNGDDSRYAFLGTRTPSTVPLPPPSCAGKKRKRAPEGRTYRAVGEPCLPPHYVGLVGGLPRDSRHLLARLGHQGYVKVLEEILDRFLYGPNAPALGAQPGAAAVTSAATAVTTTQEASPKRATPAARPRAKPGRVAAGAATKSATEAATIDTSVAAVGKEDTACLQPPLDEAPNPWRAVQTGKPHPSLSGLVEPPELARTGPKRLVLPIPNPFYRRVLHALCRVHGLCSHGGETSGDRGVGAGRGKKAGVRHRTVEITRIAAGGSGGRRRGRAERRAGVTALIPVETLLAAR